ncbi:MAG: NAD(P)-dependent oxidoreductase [Lactococcus sp.]|nr:NAD(P)-dependent oxidoreductase [Lactococcus sp.]
MKILITGATGVLGKRITKHLAKIHDVAGLTRTKSGADMLHTLNARAYIGDIRDKAFVFDMVNSFKPTVIIHQVTDLKHLSSQDNATIRKIGTQHIVAASLAYNVEKLISQSISWAYEPGKEPATEDTPLDLAADFPRKITIDGILALEKATQQLAQHVILRYGTLYGEDTWYAKNGGIHQQFLDGTAKVSHGITNFIHIQDAVAAAILAISLPTGIYNIVDDEPACGPIWAPYYAKQLNGDSNTISYLSKNPWERAVSNAAYKQNGGKLAFNSWREGMKDL